MKIHFWRCKRLQLNSDGFVKFLAQLWILYWDFLVCQQGQECHLRRQIIISGCHIDHFELHVSTSLNCTRVAKNWAMSVKLVSSELIHFRVIARLFRQIGGHSSRFVLFCSFWRLFTIKMIKSVKVFPFSFWKIIIIFFYFIKLKLPA